VRLSLERENAVARLGGHEDAFLGLISETTETELATEERLKDKPSN
jgi:hypothetical protein